MSVILSSFVGDEIDESFVKHLCETKILSSCYAFRDIKFTKNGKKACNIICRQQNKLLVPISPTKAKLKNSFCTAIGLESVTCVCAFTLSTGETNNYAFFNFMPNPVGHLAMVYFDTTLFYERWTQLYIFHVLHKTIFKLCFHEIGIVLYFMRTRFSKTNKPVYVVQYKLLCSMIFCVL